MKLRIILNQACQLKCIYCYKEGFFSEKKDLLELKDIKYVIKNARKVGFTELKFTGGEPTLYPQLLKLIKYSKKLGYKEIRITTNGILLGEFPPLISRLKKVGLDGITLTVNSLKFNQYTAMTRGLQKHFDDLNRCLEEAARVFKNKLTANIVVTKLNLSSIPKILRISKKLGIKVKLLEMTNGSFFSSIYVPFSEITRRFRGDNIEYVNSCCPSNNCKLCRKLYPVVRLSPDGKINGCIMNESSEKDILRFIKDKNSTYIGKALLSCLDKKGGNYNITT